MAEPVRKITRTMGRRRTRRQTGRDSKRRQPPRNKERHRPARQSRNTGPHWPYHRYFQADRSRDEDFPIKKLDKVLFDPRDAVPVEFESDNRLFVVPLEKVLAIFFGRLGARRRGSEGGWLSGGACDLCVNKPSARFLKPK